MYNWPNVAQRTTTVYNKLAAAAAAASCRSPTQQLLPRLRRYRAIGAWAGLVLCCVVLWLHWFWLLLQWQQPAEQVDAAVDWPSMAEMLQGCSMEEQAGEQRQRRGQQHPQPPPQQPPPQQQQQAQQKQEAHIASVCGASLAGVRRYNLRSTAKQL